MKKSILVVIFVGVLAGLVMPAFAASPVMTGGVALVDARLLLILHPRMGRFDYSLGRFFRDSAGLKDQATVQKEMNQAWETAQPAIKRLMGKQSEVIKSRYELMARHRDSMLSLDPGAVESRTPIEVRDFTHDANPAKKETIQAGNSAANIPGNEKARQVLELEKVYFQSLAGIDQQLARIQEELQEAQEQAFATVYLTTKETEKQIDGIRAEIQELIAQSAKEQGISLVMDTSFAAPPVTLSKDVYSVPAQQDQTDFLSSQLFHFFTNWEDAHAGKSVPMADGTKVDYMAHVGPKLSMSKANSFKEYLEFKPYLTKGISQFAPGSIFLQGGTDLTPLVARRIFEKYRIPADLRNALEAVLQEHRGRSSSTGNPAVTPSPPFPMPVQK